MSVILDEELELILPVDDNVSPEDNDSDSILVVPVSSKVIGVEDCKIKEPFSKLLGAITFIVPSSSSFTS